MRFATTSFLTILVLIAVTTALSSLEGASDAVQQYESLMDRLYTTIMVAVLLVVALVVVTFYYKRHVLDPMRPASGGFMAGVNDDVHGGHMEGDVLVLSRALGGQRFDTVSICEDALSSVGAGGCRLVYQRLKVFGTVDGDAVITVSDIDRDLALEVLGLPEGTGALSVYTPDTEDTRSLMEEVPEAEPTEYGFSTGVLSVELRNFRRSQGVPVPGPMALFGGLLPDEGEPASERLSDFALGFHIGNPDVLVLSTDLGGTEVRMRELDERGFDGTVPGEFYLLADIRDTMEQLNRDIRAAMISEGPVPDDIARRICRDMSRNGLLSLYTPDRADAMAMMESVAGSEGITEVHNPGRVLSFDAACLSRRSDIRGSPKVVYGPMRSPPRIQE